MTSTTYHFSSAKEVSNELFRSMLEGYQTKAFSITVAEEVVEEEGQHDEFYLTDEMKAIIEEAANSPEEDFIPVEDFIAQLRSQYGL